MKRTIALLLAVLMATVSVIAQDEAGELPVGLRLDGLDMVWQRYNRCSAGALTIYLSYYDWDGTYNDAIRWLNPNSSDVSVRLEEMAAFARRQGLRAAVRTGGTVELLESLVAAGFPVLVENAYYDGEVSWRNWVSHNRVIMGYDREQEVVYYFDSVLGAGSDRKGRPMDYADFDALWRPFNRDYLLLYRPEDETQVQAILRLDWNPAQNAQRTLIQALFDLTEYDDTFSLFNIGAALVELRRYEDAAVVFDRVFERGVPWRIQWYRFEAFEAYLGAGRYQDVVDSVRRVLVGTHGAEELYYYIARSYEGLGDFERAVTNYETAISRSSYYPEATAALAALNETLATLREE